ncbi:asparagine synthetase B family protein [Kineosporia babensis]|uniref:asparagine synthase (glutamine-hydrolyzing) n=1 Tax=Kineosporia babensis TaxID=499548 RepID=A0A9X1NMA6_9ACTN|nr:asparagine synthetase B [Kineosporia babensis]
MSLQGPHDRSWLQALGRGMNAAMAHRGEGSTSPYVSADAGVMLTSVRLAVRDRSPAGDQPMTSPDGRTVLVHNGEVYSSRDPRAPQWSPRSPGDTEFVLQQIHGSADPAAALRALSGMFALAWHDTVTGQVVLARDHFGVKPLVYSHTEGGILFASEPQALLSTGLVGAEVDPAEFVLRSWVRMDAADEHSWLRDVRVLPPAQYLSITAPRLHTRRFWSIEPQDTPVGAEEIRAAFDHALQERRAADVPRAAVLSGGVDSTAVLAGLRAAGEPVQAYVVRYQDGIGGSGEDARHAQEVAELLDTPLTVCDLDRRTAADLVSVLPGRLMRPLLHGAELAMYQLYRSISADGNVVVYSGHGADELWGYQDGGYFPIVDPAAPTHLHARHYLTHHLHARERPVWAQLIGWLARQLDVNLGEVHEQVWERVLAEYRSLPALDPLKRGRHHLLRRFLVYVNDMVDATSSSFTLEDRPVFQDVTLAELAFRAPEHLKYSQQPGSHKDLLKSALDDLLPASVRARPKQGFPSPTDPRYLDLLAQQADELGMPFGLPPLPAQLRRRLGVGEWMFLASSSAWLADLARPTTHPAAGGLMTASHPTWQWNTLTDAQEMDPQPARMPEAEAQEWCNFVLWQPTSLPDGCNEVIGTLRREAPPGRTEHTAGRTPWSAANPSAYRTEISGGGRRLRLKQFLYDWAFPAVDHPCLWGSPTRAVPIGEGRVVWLGTDYLGHPGAGARMARTTVEMSVLKGSFGDDEIRELFAGLRPAQEPVPARVLATPFHELSYWARYPVDMVSVPTGVFVMERKGRSHEGEWVATAQVPRFVSGQGLPTSVGGFRVQSAATFGDAGGARELEIVYLSDTGAELRLLLQRTGAGRLQFPPRPEKHPAHREVAQIGGRTVHLGYVDRDFGACEAVWRHPDGYDLRLLASAGAGLGRDGFAETVGRLDSALRLAGHEEVLA